MGTKEKINEKRVLMIAPVFVLLVCGGMFYSLGGGSGAKANELTASGINQSLPDAAFKKPEPGDKLGIYEMTARDSDKVKSFGAADGQGIGSGLALGLGNTLGGRNTDPTTELSAKLEALNKELAKPSPPVAVGSSGIGTGFSAAGQGQPASIKNDVDRLESLMRTMQDKRKEDPEVTQLSGMLDKIISIQNPELAAQRLRVDAKLGLSAAAPDSQFRAVPAIIVDKQKVTQGASVRLRLMDSLRIGAMLIPKGHELFALCQLSNHRLLLNIKNIRLGTSIIPVNLSVYSLDGMAGIDAPSAELGVAAGAGFNDAMQGMQFLSMDQSIGVQAAGAGIDAAKSLLSKKVRKVRVPLKAGFKVLLRNNQAVH